MASLYLFVFFVFFDAGCTYSHGVSLTWSITAVFRDPTCSKSLPADSHVMQIHTSIFWNCDLSCVSQTGKECKIISQVNPCMRERQRTDFFPSYFPLLQHIFDYFWPWKDLCQNSTLFLFSKNLLILREIFTPWKIYLSPIWDPWDRDPDRPLPLLTNFPQLVDMDTWQ